MPKVKAFGILLLDPQDVYYPGQSCNGHIFLDLNVKKVVKHIEIRIRGLAEVSWTEGRGDDAVGFNESETYIDQSKILFPPDGETSTNVLFEAGRHVFPFSFLLPLGIPMSFEREAGFVRYSLNAKCNTKGSKKENKILINVGFSGLDLNTFSNALTSVQDKDEFSTWCLCCKSNPITASLRVDRTGYVPGDRIVIDAEIFDGARSGINRSYIQLLKRIVFTDRRNETMEEEPLYIIQLERIPPGCTKVYSGQLLPVPAVIPSFRPAPECSIIRTVYLVQLVMIAPGAFKPFKMEVEIIIGTIPLLSQGPSIITNQPHCPGKLHELAPPFTHHLPTAIDVNLPFYAMSSDSL